MEKRREGGRGGGRGGSYLDVFVHQIDVIVHGLISAKLVEAKPLGRAVIARGEDTGKDG